MYIKQYKKFKYQFNNYSLLNIKREYPISYVAIFFYDAFSHIYGYNTHKFIQKLKSLDQNGMSSEMIELTLDNKNNLAYISELFEESAQEITPEIDQLLETESTIELCHRNIVGHTVMTKENLFHLLLKWTELVDKKAPYILIYQDEKNWYDSLPFDTQEAMEEFVADHTQK